jgi:SAM-dependent methyltransferase
MEQRLEVALAVPDRTIVSSRSRISELEPVQVEKKSDASRLQRFGRQELFEALQRVIATFPARVVDKGINRNWCHYRYLLKSLGPFWSQLPDRAEVCDLGAGAGVVPLVMAQFGFRMSLIDQWSEYQAKYDNQMGTTEEFFARFQQFGAKYYSCDILTERVPLPDESQDVVSAFAVLEHLPRPRLLLDEIYRLLRPGGLVVITVPNGANLRNRIRLLFGQTPHLDHWEAFYARHFFGHYREPTAKELREIFERDGYDLLLFRTSGSSQINTKRPDGKWLRGWRPTSINQLIRGLYVLTASVHPSLRYDILLVGRKAMS